MLDDQQQKKDSQEGTPQQQSKEVCRMQVVWEEPTKNMSGNSISSYLFYGAGITVGLVAVATMALYINQNHLLYMPNPPGKYIFAFVL
jgi:hypothetical protein